MLCAGLCMPGPHRHRTCDCCGRGRGSYALAGGTLNVVHVACRRAQSLLRDSESLLTGTGTRAFQGAPVNWARSASARRPTPPEANITAAMDATERAAALCWRGPAQAVIWPEMYSIIQNNKAILFSSLTTPGRPTQACSSPTCFQQADPCLQPLCLGLARMPCPLRARDERQAQGPRGLRKTKRRRRRHAMGLLEAQEAESGVPSACGARSHLLDLL